MTKILTNILTVILCLCLDMAACFGQSAGKTGGKVCWGGAVEVDRSINDFGEVLVSDGPLKCSFEVTNVSGKALTILNVVSSCGCTDVSWTKTTLPPGSKGVISATYRNTDGAGPFDKSLTAYFSDVSKPLVLRLRGIVRSKAIPLEDAYPVHFGAFSLRDIEIQGPNVEAGQERGGEVKVANTSSKPIKVTFKDVSEGLTLELYPSSTIPAGGTATLSYLISPEDGRYGRRWYYATPLVDGRTMSSAFPPSCKEPSDAKGAEAVLAERNTLLAPGSTMFGIKSWTKPDLSDSTPSSGPQAKFENPSYSFGTIKAGTTVKASFKFTTSGKGEYVIYAMDTDTPRLKASMGRDRRSINTTLDTSGLPKGEVLVILTLTTNSPSRPLRNLYITGFIK